MPILQKMAGGAGGMPGGMSGGMPNQGQTAPNYSSGPSADEVD